MKHEMEMKNCEVFLVSAGPKKIEVIKVIRYYADLGLKEAKDLAESAPRAVWSGVAEDVAGNMVRDLENAGAVAEIREASGGVGAGPRSHNRSGAPGGGGRVIRIGDPGRNTLEVIKVIRLYTGLDLKQAKVLVESAPGALCHVPAGADAERMRHDLERAGATAWVTGGTDVVPSPGEPGAGGDYAVFLVDPGPRTIDVIKVVRRYTGMGLKEAKILVEGGGGPVSSGVSQETAENIWHDLHNAGATVEVRAL
jgi:large subunit ribosomal protein L7/L12